MITPKNPRLQAILGDTPASPFRRRSALNVSVSALPPPSPVNNSIIETHTNDDEDERRKSRRFETSINENESATNLAEAENSLNSCLKLFAENKINKDNAWSLNIIDSFAKLIQKHHHVLSNFQIAGTTLEASAKVYGLRVDSVYTDVLRMSSELARQSAKSLTNRGNRLDNEEDSDHDRDGNDKENHNATGQPEDPQQPKQKKVKKRKNISTITRNPDSLNARLDTNPLTDPFFAKLNSVIGDTNSSKRLMQNIIPTENSKLKLRQNMPVWSSKDQAVLNLEAKIDFNDVAVHKNLSVNPTCIIQDVNRYFVRQGLSSYKLTNEPIERYDDNDTSRYGNDMDNTVIHNSIHMEHQFDINAEVEPVMLEKSVMMDFGDMDNNDFDDLNEQDRIAVDRCKGLRRTPIVIEDMQPETCANLEYSYRPLDMIDQFWAGPSHWKFRQSRRTSASLGARASHMTNATQEMGADGQKNKVVRKRKIARTLGELLIGDIYNIDENMQNCVVKISPRMKGTQLSVQTISKKWDAKKHKLPQDYKIALDTFDKFLYASTIHISSNSDVTFTGTDDNDGAPYDYDNETDRNYCSRLENQSDTETETNTDMGQMDNNEFDQLEMPPPSAPVDEIPDIFIGAPERIEKISIAFARRAKVVDMKQLKTCSWNLIKDKHNADPLHNPKFSDTLKSLPKVLSRTMAENMSMPLAFYAVLHLCNDKSLLLDQNDELLKDFEIQFLHETSSAN